jgi:GT2 family glycosyltransferase
VGSAVAVAVAVVSWNTRELLDACLTALAPYAESGRAEVWVVDNGSSDGSPGLVRERYPWARLVVLASNTGFGAAVNRVAACTDAPWIAAANADIALGELALETLLAAGDAHPAAGSIAPRLTLPDGTVQHSVHAFPGVSHALLFNSGLARLVPSVGERLAIEGRWDSDRAREVDWALGAFLLIRRSAFDAVGGFDERQWMYAEDLDLGWRLARAGWSTRYEPAAVVLHASAAATAQAWGDERTERWMWSTYAWLLRRRGIAVVRATAVVNIAGAALRAALLTPRAWRDPGRFAGRRAGLLEWVRLHRIGLAPRDALERHR